MQLDIEEEAVGLPHNSDPLENENLMGVQEIFNTLSDLMEKVLASLKNVFNVR
ncbi:MAG: hypothetical protein PHH70_02635 [Candidatus Gracilibacteria bacterium]|nr:hypothetical protein [Candidatus Gracilibacteria bacterium]